MTAIIHYALAILEGGLSGAYFYYAGQEKEKERKILLYTISALWFLSSLLSSLEGGREWKKQRKAKKQSQVIDIIEDEEEIEGEYEDE